MIEKLQSRKKNVPSAVGFLPVSPFQLHTILPHLNSRFCPPSQSTSTVRRSLLTCIEVEIRNESRIVMEGNSLAPGRPQIHPMNCECGFYPSLSKHQCDAPGVRLWMPFSTQWKPIPIHVSVKRSSSMFYGEITSIQRKKMEEIKDIRGCVVSIKPQREAS